MSSRTLVTDSQDVIGLKVEYMEPFVQAALTVLEEVSGSSPEPGPLGLAGTTFPAASTNIAARVGGCLAGDVVYSMSGPTARELAGMITGAKAHGFGRVMGSALARLGEMLARETGLALFRQGLDCVVSSPIIFQGLNVEFTVVEPALSVPIETSAGRLLVSVAVRNA